MSEEHQRGDRRERPAAIADRLVLVAQMLESAVGELNDLMTTIKEQEGGEPEW